MNHTYIYKEISINKLYDIVFDINTRIFNSFFIIEKVNNIILIKFNDENSLMTLALDNDGIYSRINCFIYNSYVVYLELKIMSHIAYKLGLDGIQPEGIGEDVSIYQYLDSKYDDILNKKKWYEKLLFNPRKQLKNILTKEIYKKLLTF